jgi:cholinesterase
MSGVANAFGVNTSPQAIEIWTRATAAAGCGVATASQEAALSCMRGKRVETILQVVPTITGGGSFIGPFTPIADDTVVFANNQGRKSIPVPMLVGNTDNESGYFRMLAAMAGQTLPQVVWDGLNTNIFTCPAAARAASSVQSSNPTWRYRYFGDFPNLRLSTNPTSGAWHGSDVSIDTPCLAPQGPFAITGRQTHKFTLDIDGLWHDKYGRRGRIDRRRSCH